MIKIDFTPLQNIQSVAAEQITDNPAASVLNSEVKERRQIRGAYRQYQENSQKAEQAKIRILKGVKSGMPAAELLKEAAECIGLLTGDKSFFNQVETDIQLLEELQEGTQPTMPELKHRLELMKRCIENELKKL